LRLAAGLCCAREARRAPCRSKTSSSLMANRIASRASSSWRSRRRCSPPINVTALSRSLNVSTRTFPRSCWRRASTSMDGKLLARVSPAAVWRRLQSALRKLSAHLQARASTNLRPGALRARQSTRTSPRLPQCAPPPPIGRRSPPICLRRRSLRSRAEARRAELERSMPSSDFADVAAATAVVHKPLPHDSARLHVQGAATYVDDIGEPVGTLHIAIGMANKASGRLKSLGLEAVRDAPGVVTVLTAADIPGKNDVAPVFADEPLFAFDEILFHGQALFAVAARTRDQARRAARLAKIDIEAGAPAVTIADALVSGARVQDDYSFRRGDAATIIDNATNGLDGLFHIGGQEHFYLEGQASFAFPGEADGMTVHASTQDPTETQHIVARILGIPDAFVTVETRRMGGGFGGKESQACAWAAIAALAARRTGRPCKVRLDRDDDFALTGKRHDFRADWRVGYDGKGVIGGYEVALNARCGCSADLSPGVCDRAMFHAGNGYWLPDVSILTRRLKTNTVSNTAFRGFGGPQGMIAIERVMDAIARER